MTGWFRGLCADDGADGAPKHPADDSAADLCHTIAVYPEGRL